MRLQPHVDHAVWRWESDAFGTTVPTGSATVNLRFPGQYLDAETGLHYNWHRTYDPASGRYVESDPIGLAGGLNTYSYAFNNAVGYTDPDGRIVPFIMAAGMGLRSLAVLAPVIEMAMMANSAAIGEPPIPGGGCGAAAKRVVISKTAYPE